MNTLRTPNQRSAELPFITLTRRRLGWGAVFLAGAIITLGCASEAYEDVEKGSAVGIEGGSYVQVHGVDPANTNNVILEVCPEDTTPDPNPTKLAAGCAPVSVNSLTLAINTQGVPAPVESHTFQAEQMITTKPDAYIEGNIAG